jgi:hypothetical protein
MSINTNNFEFKINYSYMHGSFSWVQCSLFGSSDLTGEWDSTVTGNILVVRTHAADVWS